MKFDWETIFQAGGWCGGRKSRLRTFLCDKKAAAALATADEALSSHSLAHRLHWNWIERFINNFLLHVWSLARCITAWLMTANTPSTKLCTMRHTNTHSDGTEVHNHECMSQSMTSPRISFKWHSRRHISSSRPIDRRCSAICGN